LTRTGIVLAAYRLYFKDHKGTDRCRNILIGINHFNFHRVYPAVADNMGFTSLEEATDYYKSNMDDTYACYIEDGKINEIVTHFLYNVIVDKNDAVNTNLHAYFCEATTRSVSESLSYFQTGRLG